MGQGGVGKGDEGEEKLFVGPFTRRRGSNKTKKAEEGRCCGRSRRGDLSVLGRCGLGSRGRRGRRGRGGRGYGFGGGSGFGCRGVGRCYWRDCRSGH